MTHASLFSGIGGPEVAAAMLGWENLFNCDINPFTRKVLNYWFPNAVTYEDIKNTDFTKWQGRVDVLTGGFPCQPFSTAGKRGGADDNRYLWPQMCRVIQEVRPTWVVAENVDGITTMVESGPVTEMGCEGSLFGEGDGLYRYQSRDPFTIERVCGDFERAGYSVQPCLIPACAVGAPHRRDRIFFIAHLEDSVKHGLPERETQEQGRFRDERNTGAGGDERICSEERSDAADSYDARTEGLRQFREDKVCESAIAPDSDCHGRDEMGEHLQSELADGNESLRDGRLRDAADSNGTGLQESEQPGREANQEETGAGLHDRTKRLDSGNAADTESESAVRHKSGQREAGSKKQGKLGGGRCKNGSDENTSDTDCTGLERSDNAGRNEAKHGDRIWRDVAGYDRQAWSLQCAELLPCNRWRSFPTVSPVFRGNDGIPFPVDDLTISFAQWRKGALEAYGNAIVPQVMYEIFRAIQEVENNG